MILVVRLFPDEGPFDGTQVDFEIRVPQMYPHRPPKAKILQKVKKTLDETLKLVICSL